MRARSAVKRLHTSTSRKSPGATQFSTLTTVRRNKSYSAAFVQVTHPASSKFHQEWSCMSRTFAAIAALTFIFASSAASAQMLKTADTPKGKTFVDAKGMTLYTFDKDAGGKSMCNGPCADNWPALVAPDDAKPTTNITILVPDAATTTSATNGTPTS